MDARANYYGENLVRGDASERAGDRRSFQNDPEIRREGSAYCVFMGVRFIRCRFRGNARLLLSVCVYVCVCTFSYLQIAQLHIVTEGYRVSYEFRESR